MGVSMTRGCGERVKGGIYAECLPGLIGYPIEHFIKDAPEVMDFEAMGVTPIGVKLIEFGGVWHIFDWVGEKHYPYPADFIEEARVMGVSRRLSRSLAFEKLSSASRMFLIHAKAHVLNPYDYYDNWGDTAHLRYNKACPKGKCTCSGNDRIIRQAHEREGHSGMCAKIWWHDIEGDGLMARRTPGSDIAYQVSSRPAGVTPDYAPAVFGIFPIPRLVIIKDPDGDSHTEAKKLAGASEIQVFEEEA